jgi:hypothetical protein
MSRDLLYNLSERISENFRQKNIDFLDIFTYCKVKFARNIFRSKSHFKNNKFYMGKFDHDYVQQNEVDTTFLNIQHKLTYFRKIFRLNKWNMIVELEYIDFINESMKTVIEEIIEAIKDFAPKYKTIVEKYEETKDSKPKRSDKINYEALKAMGIEID